MEKDYLTLKCLFQGVTRIFGGEDFILPKKKKTN